MIAEMSQLKEQYLAWLRDETTLREVNGWVEITSPFVDRHNDYTQIYIKQCGDEFTLTDDGYTINDLEMSGCSLDSPKRQQLLKTTLRGYDIHLDEETKELTTRATQHNFAIRKHCLLQAMLAVNDLYYLATPYTVSFFIEDIRVWLSAANIRYVSSLMFRGNSGFNHQFDIVIPASLKQPERVLLGINRPDRGNIERVVFAWEDTKQTRQSDSRAVAILNDSEKPVSESVMDALRNYDVHPAPWSQRESIREELAA